MLLRRVTEHVRAQNWAAVALDFVIVVVGVLFALTAEQWLSESQQRSDLENAEIALNRDLLTNLFAARELEALAPCRKERTALLSELLEQDGDRWAGIPWEAHPGVFDTRLPELLPTPYRFWGSRAWMAEQQTGTLNSMDGDRRRRLERIFNGTNAILVKQEEVFRAQSRLKTLAMERPIGPADRLRYLETLHYYDQQAGLLERMSMQTMEQIDSIGFTSDEYYLEEFGDYMPRYLAERASRYGDCFVSFDMPFLE